MIKGRLVGVDGIAYYFDAEVQVKAVDLDNDFVEITLDESSQPNSVEDIHATTSRIDKIVQNGQVLIITSENTYSVDGRKRD